MSYYLNEPYQNKHYQRRMIVLDVVATPEILRLISEMPEIVDPNSSLIEIYERDHHNRAVSFWFEIAPYLDEVEAWCKIDDAIKEYIKTAPWRNALSELGLETE